MMPRYIDRMFYTTIAAIVVGAVIGYTGVLLDNFPILVADIIVCLVALALWSLTMLALRREVASRGGLR
jgi:ABC-type dipeptide/oligopeptide/nickel transport system permease subunit